MKANSVYVRTRTALQSETLKTAVRTTTDKLRIGRNNAVAKIGDFDALRHYAERVRRHTIDHLDHYLQKLAARIRAAGGNVFFAATDKDAVNYVLQLAQREQVRRVVKSKSMVSEEIELNSHLAKHDIETIETDLGEYIVQLGEDTPSHLITPALHKSRSEITELFSGVAGRPLSPDTASLTAFARETIRAHFLNADMGITGCNFAVAETGTVALVTNEGNGRMVTSLPRIQVTLMGMERIVPTMADLDLMLELLARSATGQKVTTYTSLVTGPRRTDEPDGPEQLHVVIVDNGRSNLLGGGYQDALHCIRCGACQNVCPVYRHIGGHAYGWVYAGPIGAVITPLLQGMEQWGELAEASSLCAACTEVCPVNIPLHDMLINLRRDNNALGYTPRSHRAMFRMWRSAFAKPRRFRLTLQAARLLQKPFAREQRLRWGPPPISSWLKERDLPAIAPQSFREWWQSEGGSETSSGGEIRADGKRPDSDISPSRKEAVE